MAGEFSQRLTKEEEKEAENAAKFRYMETTVTNKNYVHEEIAS
jgi:hypothetical protein